MSEGLKILIVDRDKNNIAILSEALISTGFIVDSASSGGDAIDKIEKGIPGLVISEINLPEMDGWELCWVIRQRQDLADIPFIFLTTKNNIPDEIFSLELGADDYITKPFIRNELIARVKALIARVERDKRSYGALPRVGVKGSLRDMTLTDILQLLNMGKRTAAVHLFRNNDKGTIFMADGQIVHAGYGDTKGEEALFHLLSWGNGSFSVETGANAALKTIKLPTEKILLEGFKRMDEGKRRGAPPISDAMEESEALTIKTLFDLGIIVDKRKGEK